MLHMPIRQYGVMKVCGSFSALAWTKEIVREHFLGLHIELVDGKRTCVDNGGS